MKDYVSLNRGDVCPRTGGEANPFKCSEANGAGCSYLDGIAIRELTTMTVVDSIRCKHPDLKEKL